MGSYVTTDIAFLFAFPLSSFAPEFLTKENNGKRTYSTKA